MLFYRSNYVGITTTCLACMLIAGHAVAQNRPAAPAATVPRTAPRAPQQIVPGANPIQQRPQNVAPRTGARHLAQQPANPFKQDANELKRLNDLLGFWEVNSGKVKTYSCEFTRFDYNKVFGPQDPKLPLSKSEGTIRYAAPDKGEFKVTTIAKYQPNAKGEPAWPKVAAGHDEHWVCDGDSVFEFNGKTKQLIEEKLPPQMKGNAIAEGPLPFMFGAKRDKLLTRYWMKELKPPADRKGEYWFDVRPKTRADAANFQRILVVLDQKEFLPVAMQIYPPGFGANNWSRQAYTFAKRKVNHPLQRNQNWLGQFIRPQVPRGWKKVVQNFGQPLPGAAPIRVATPPGSPRVPATGKPIQPGQPR